MVVYGFMALIAESVADWLDPTVRRVQLDSVVRERQVPAFDRSA